MTTEQRIEQAAEKFGEDTGETIRNVKRYGTHNDRTVGYAAGANWAIQQPELIVSELKKFLRWQRYSEEFIDTVTDTYLNDLKK
jgi:hypothetical protein